MASTMYLPAKKRWRVRKHVTDKFSGQIRRYDVLVASRTEAVKTAAEFDRIAKGVKSGQSTPDQISSAVAAWLSLARSRTERVYDLYRRNISRFVDSLPHHVSWVNQIQPIHIYTFIAMITKTRTAATGNRYLTVVKSFCRWVSRKYSLPNPATAVDMLPEPDPESRFFSQSEYDSILRIASPWHKDLFMFLSNTGLRATEFCTLRWSNVADDHSSLTTLGKGRKKRTVPLNSACKAILKRLQTPHTNPADPIFISKSAVKKYYGRPLTRGGLYNLCSDYACRLAIPSFGPHAFRHWFATRLLLAGVPIAHVAMMLGHSSIATTQRHYIHILPRHLQGLTECLAAAAVVGGTASDLVEKGDQKLPGPAPVL